MQSNECLGLEVPTLLGELMKYISPVEINLRKFGYIRDPHTDITYGCLFSSNSSAGIEEEVEEATSLTQTVTWIAEPHGLGIEGAIYGPDPADVEQVRAFLTGQKDWHARETGQFGVIDR